VCRSGRQVILLMDGRDSNDIINKHHRRPVYLLAKKKKIQLDDGTGGFTRREEKEQEDAESKRTVPVYGVSPGWSKHIFPSKTDYVRHSCCVVRLSRT